MSIKPFSEVVEETPHVNEKPKPFVDVAQGGVEVNETLLDHEGRQENVVGRSISFLGSFQGLMVSALFFFMVVLFVDAVESVQTLFKGTSFLNMLYLFGLSVLLVALAMASYRNYSAILMLKSAHRHQRAFAEQKTLATKKIIPMTLQLLSAYKDNNLVQQRAEVLKERMSSSHEYSAIYEELDSDVVGVLDAEVQRRIKVASTQAALSTAISPLALLDAGIVIWRSVRLTREIAEVYGFKPSWVATVVLMKRGAFSVFFAGATELAVEYVNAASESTLVSKISFSAGQGISNGILLARLGYGVMSACRPLPMRVKRQSFIVSIMGTLKDAVIKQDKQGKNGTAV